MSYPTGYSGYGRPIGPASVNQDIKSKQTEADVYEETDGEFFTRTIQPKWLEAGASGRFSCYFQDINDGAISFTMAPNTVFPTLTVRDANGSSVQSSGTNGITINVIQADPAQLGNFFCQVQIGAAVQPGPYIIEWNANYQPNAQNNITQPNLPIRRRRFFLVKSTLGPSQFFIMDTEKF